jgi:hypothetical protein
MHFYAIAALSLALAPALSLAEPQPYLLRAATHNELFGLMKRQEGYAPKPHTCGAGATCAEACGPTQIECPSDSGKHCYDPSIKQICCSDGSGLACDDGYFCTTDSAGGTWCCPDGLDLVACAAMYTVTGLSSLSAYAAPTGAPDTTAPPTNVTTTTTAAPAPPANSTINIPAPAPPTFSGAANAHAVGGLALPLALAGALAAL